MLEVYIVPSGIVLASGTVSVFRYASKLSKGNGYLAGEFPGGTTTVEGAPVSATVRVLLRTESGHAGDGAVVAEVQSAPDGTWRVDGLPTGLKYDVVGRKNGHNDVIMANVTPTSMMDISYIDNILPNETFTGALGYIELAGGMPPYAASVVDPLPAGLFPVVDGHQLIIDGTTTDDDVFNSTVRVTSSNGVTKDVPVKLVVGFKAPANFEAETLEDAGAFSVVLTWGVTNTTQEVLVFKSTTPFDLESLPAPIATLAGDAVSYTDDDVIEDDVLYYMAASVCEGFTLYSDEVEVVVVADPLLPSAIGEFFQGGYYIGDIEDQGKHYKILVAPIEADVYGLRWKTANTATTGTDSLTDGWSNTWSMNNASHPAALHCLNYRGDGHDDWYMPAKDELNLFWLNIAPSRTQAPDFMSGGPQALNESHYYWASTQYYTTSSAWIQKDGIGNQGGESKGSTSRRVRPVRRLEFTP